MPYVDLNTIHNPATGTVAPATWGDQARDNFEFLIDPPICSVSHSTTQSITSGTATDILANTEAFDNDSMHSTVTNTGRITIQTAGRYLLYANVNWAANSTGQRQLQFHLNDTTFFGNDRRQTTSALEAINQTMATRALVVGDYVEVNVFQNSGGALNVTLNEFTVLFLTR